MEGDEPLSGNDEAEWSRLEKTLSLATGFWLGFRVLALSGHEGKITAAALYTLLIEQWLKGEYGLISLPIWPVTSSRSGGPGGARRRRGGGGEEERQQGPPEAGKADQGASARRSHQDDGSRLRGRVRRAGSLVAGGGEHLRGRFAARAAAWGRLAECDPRGREPVRGIRRCGCGNKIGGAVAGSFWHVIGLCRFEPGELDPYLPELRVPEHEPLFTRR